MKLEVSANPSFTASPYPPHKRQGEETLANGTTVAIPPGSSLPDYIRAVYGIQRVEPFAAQFSFLNRDDTDKRYDPGVTDKFVFRDRRSIEIFHREARSILALIVAHGKSIGIPVSIDPDRRVSVLDFSGISSKDISPLKREEIAILASNQDIALRFCLQRTVTPGWWAVSYDGKTAPDGRLLKKAAVLLADVMTDLRSAPGFKKVLKEVQDKAGDPLDTSVGFPFFTAEVTAEGTPVSKLKVVTKYADAPHFSSWEEAREWIASKGSTEFERTHLFAIAPLRRIQAGYKWQHAWSRSASGLKFVADIRGQATNRVAWMAPYLLNLYLSPIQMEWKALRKLIPGLTADGESRKAQLDSIRKTSLLLAESDFSNYDRSIPNDVMDVFFFRYCQKLPRAAYWFGLLRQTHTNLPICWPDHLGSLRGKGWLFTVKDLALLSGLKITSEVGSFMNMIINIAGWLRTGLMDENAIKQYLKSDLNAVTTGQYDQRVMPKVLIASDDTLFCASSQTEIDKLIKAFEVGAKSAGIKTSVAPGDKFLMRHLSRGSDRPVASRVWQNTLSNEDPADDPFKFTVGLVTRTDGLMGWKTFDPFLTGRNVGVTEIDLKISLRVVESLLQFLRTARQPLSLAIEFCEALLRLGKSATVSKEGLFFPNERIGKDVDDLRRLALKLLAQRELNTGDIKSSYIKQLMANINSPAAAMALTALSIASPNVQAMIDKYGALEHSFYVMAMKKLGLSIDVT